MGYNEEKQRQLDMRYLRMAASGLKIRTAYDARSGR